MITFVEYHRNAVFDAEDRCAEIYANVIVLHLFAEHREQNHRIQYLKSAAMRYVRTGAKRLTTDLQCVVCMFFIHQLDRLSYSLH